jgi:hypothetical protein
MHEDKIAHYRAEAATCIVRADMDTNRITATRWRRLAEEWTRMADELESRNPKSGPNIAEDGGN